MAVLQIDFWIRKDNRTVTLFILVDTKVQILERE